MCLDCLYGLVVPKMVIADYKIFLIFNRSKGEPDKVQPDQDAQNATVSKAMRRRLATVFIF